MAWYEIKNSSAVDSPALLVYPDRVRENIRIMKSFADDVSRLRPHIKTSKSPEALALLLEAGITKIKCATITELEMAATAGVPDILLAYQPSGPKAKRFAGVVKKFPHITFGCLVDNLASAKEIGMVMTSEGLSVNAWLDLNVGMNRTGIAPGAEAAELFSRLYEIKGLRPYGLHAYDGHLRDHDLSVRTQKCDAAFQPVEALSAAIESATGNKPVICAGGTPTFPIHARRKSVECSPGTFIYWDTGYGDLLKEQPYLHAALVMTRVLSKPAPGLLCLDLGHKSIAAENPITNRVRLMDGEDFEPIGQSEEHLVIKTAHADRFQVGQVLYGVPFHVCPTVALYDEAWSVRDGMASPDWHQPARKK